MNGPRICAGAARNRASSAADDRSARPSALIQYMACSTSSRTRRASSSLTATPVAGTIGADTACDAADRLNGRRVGVEVERGGLGPLGLEEPLVVRDGRDDLQVMLRGELLDRGLVVAVADLVGYKKDAFQPQPTRELGHPPTRLE